MSRIFLLLILLSLPLNTIFAEKTEIPATATRSEYELLYGQLQLDGVVDYDAFVYACEGYNKIQGIKKEIITLIDFTKPSTEERLFVLDMKKKNVIFISHVSHGKNSGDNYATSFSNVSGSNKSSLGFFLTEKTYQGKNGYSLRLEGLEKGINDKAMERAIVIHGADYSNPSVISSMGRLGRSLGCPALPTAVSRKIIDTIKEGSLLFIYSNDKSYLANSNILERSNNSRSQSIASL